jgi:3-oxoacyl-[acyl-carrier-protein] synthase-3
LAAAGVGNGAVDCYILSHIIPGVAQDSARVLGVPPAKVLDAGERHGHLTAAALPVALSEALAERRVGAGATVCLAACGAGFTWGAAVLTI